MCSAIAAHRIDPYSTLEEYVDSAYALEDLLTHTRHQRRVKSLIRDSYNQAHLKYIRTELWGTPYTTIRKNAEIHRQKAKRLRSSYIPPADIKSFTTLDENGNIQKWKQLFKNATIAELKDLAVYIQAETETKNCAKYRILYGLVFYKNNNNSIFTTIYELNNRGDGLSVLEQENRLSTAFKQLNPIIGSLLLGHIEKITTNSTESSNEYGSAKNYGTWLNFVSDTEAGGISTVAHEVGHALQYAFGIYCNSSIDNRDADRVQHKNYNIQKNERDNNKINTFQNEMSHLWNLFINEEVSTIRPYQEKNFNEFFACAFEHWVFNEVEEEYTAFFNKYVGENTVLC